MTALAEMNRLGHAPWLRYLRRSFIEAGKLSEMIEEGVRGVGVDIAVISQSITWSADYDRVLTQLQSEGVPFDQIPHALLIDDVQRAAYVLTGVYDDSDRLDGYVSLPLAPSLAHDMVGTIATARHLLADINCPNVMVEIPATSTGIAAIEALTADGTCVNATLIFSLDTYEQVAEAYLAGLAEYIRSHSVWRRWPTSVATISVGEMDRIVDALLAENGRSDLQGGAGLAVAGLIYGRCQQIMHTPRWQPMKKKGAHPQRPLWTHLTPHDFRYPDTYYANALIGPNTASSLTPAMLNAFRDHGLVASTLSRSNDEASAHLNALAAVGIDLEMVAQQLQAEALDRLTHEFSELRNSVRQKREQLEDQWQRLEIQPGFHETAVNQTMTRLCDQQVMCRIWNHDPAIWPAEVDEIKNQLGWLHVVPAMQRQIGRLQTLLYSLLADDYHQAVLIGMSGFGLTPQLFGHTFDQAALPPKPGLPPRPHLQLNVLNDADPATVPAQTARLDLARTLFVVSSKSGRSAVTMATLHDIYEQAAATLGAEEAGRHFIAITDPGSPLAAMARQRHFREIFYNDPHMDGCYTALSFIGLVPAALTGVNLELLLERAQGMTCNAHGCNRPLQGDNAAAQLGAALGALIQMGHSRPIFIASSALDGFAYWVGHLTTSLGVAPLVGEPVNAPSAYGDDRFFVYLRLDGDDTYDSTVESLIAADYPVITLHWQDLDDLGGQFFLWQMATAVAAHCLQIQPFQFDGIARYRTAV